MIHWNRILIWFEAPKELFSLGIGGNGNALVVGSENSIGIW